MLEGHPTTLRVQSLKKNMCVYIYIYIDMGLLAGHVCQAPTQFLGLTPELIYLESPSDISILVGHDPLFWAMTPL